jgi:hypothetical protein
VVKIGFIVEGDSEKVVIESDSFRAWAREQGVEVCSPVINAKGGGNLLPHHIQPMIAQFQVSQADHVVILTDLDDAPSIEAVKARITTQHTNLIFVAVRALEAWFLADTDAMRHWLSKDDFFEEFPEETPGMPWDRLKAVANELGARGPGPNKVIFAQRMCKTLGFRVAKASAHPNCASARQFHDGLVGLFSNLPQPVD